MKLKEFLEQNNTILIAEANKCKTVEELEAFAKANDLELTKEEFESIKLRFGGENVALSDDELDSVAGGKDGGKQNYHNRPECPQDVQKFHIWCSNNCTEFVPQGGGRRAGRYLCKHPKRR